MFYVVVVFFVGLFVTEYEQYTNFIEVTVNINYNNILKITNKHSDAFLVGNVKFESF